MVDISMQKIPEAKASSGQTAVTKVESSQALSDGVMLDKKMHRIGDRLVEQ